MSKSVDYSGIIIEESLADISVLDTVKVISTKVESVTEAHKTPWVKQWTMHMVEVSADKIAKTAEKISNTLDKEHNWYADLRTDTEHYVIYSGKVFHITDRTDKKQYDAATEYGISVGIPSYQVDFSPYVKEWGR